jgi:hypothetical protein
MITKIMLQSLEVKTLHDHYNAFPIAVITVITAVPAFAALQCQNVELNPIPQHPQPSNLYF